MKIIHKTIAATSALVLSLGLAFPVAAQSIYGTVESKTQGTVDLGTVRVGTDADVEVKVDTDLKASNSSVSGSSDIKGEVGERDDEGVCIAATGTVHGDPDFDLAMQAESSEDNVAVTSKQHAKLFGFIPVTVNATAVVDANGRVKVKFPWYAFLMVTNKADLESKIETQTKVITAREAGSGMATGRVATGDVNGDGVEASVKLSADVQARLIAAIKVAMQSEWTVDTTRPDTD